jgi:hypothetical protein
MSTSKAGSILEQIRRRQPDPYGIMKAINPPTEEIKFAKTHLSADGWQDFKRRWIEEYGGEPVQPTGMTHSEFLHYIASSGERENDQFTERQRLEALLRKLDNENPPV